QRDNAIVAIAVLGALRQHGFAVDEAAIRQALTDVRWPGRLEHLRHGTTEILLDAAHNPAGARALAVYLRDSGWTDATLVFGAMSDKNARGMLAALMPVTRRVICTTPATARATPAHALAGVASSLDDTGDVEIVEDPTAALERACAISRRVVVAGSIFLVGPLRGILR
ncbi:MAG TPA: cyanophycin synthetase, partial [Vicinamibacterales bacterium]|nr:cyanophycin synthetase [Vicinamibacterales bacterium]